MDLRQLGAVGKRFAAAGNPGEVRPDHLRISEDRGHKASSVLTDRDQLPRLVPSELGKREPIRYFHGVLILSGPGQRRQNTEKYSNEYDEPDTLAFHA